MTVVHLILKHSDATKCLTDYRPDQPTLSAEGNYKEGRYNLE